MVSHGPLILAVDDETNMLKTYESILSRKYPLLTADSAARALQIIQNQPVAIVLLDLRMPGMDGLELLRKIRKNEGGIEVIVITASKDIAPAVEAMKRGAFDYLTKPFDFKELETLIEKAIEKNALVRENLYLKEALKDATGYCDLIGQTPVMINIFDTIAKVAQTDSTVLIHGESGTGKELVARALHQKSKRSAKPFIAVNCAAIPENLLESELFGHERGSFTGALERRLGKFELADEGTIFLDEIGCMSMAMQAKLLRVLEERKIERLGGEKTIGINIRVVSASNIDFKKAIDEGKFRADLFYRLNVIPVMLPPLRERKEDIPLFVRHFTDKFNLELNKKVQSFSPAAIQVMLEYEWPGNVRELQNLIERVIVLAQGEVIPREEIPIVNPLARPADEASSRFHQLMEEHERKIIKKALAESNQNHTLAAKALGIARSTLNSKIEVLGLS